ncbi:hypothetical protein LMG26686_00979 [Achromobacter mucicolens]|uniref:c-type cytochrome n=1 Tax=Achromobacter mucicolens TaxID=1389922 RepID=UPI001466E1D8|nr:hypothetical protein LMG26686_00979 [Achromobacter mucicolens]
MPTRDKRSGQRVEDVDPTFDPWEPSKPIPLFVLGIFIALAAWGGLSYLGDLVPERAPNVDTVMPAPGAVKQSSSSTNDSPRLIHSGSAEVWSCASCHGAGGQGAGQTPQLAGLNSAYIVKQLQDFVSGARSNESMRYVAAQLSPSEMNEVAAYYSALSVPAPTPPKDNGRFSRGRELNLRGDWNQDVPACATCHGGAGEGLGATFPRLAGQQSEYLFSQLAAWKGGKRRNSPQSLMEDIASRMSDEDMWAAAQYFGSLGQENPKQEGSGQK